jgi:hypothetical protein
MNRTACLFALALFATACDKKQPPPDPPADEGDATDATPPVAIDDSVPQEPDPPEIAAAADLYLKGEYARVIETLTPIFADLREREQYRASALAGMWLTLAHAESVFENGKEPSAWAESMAQSTDDPEVDAAAGLAMAVYLTGAEEYDRALQHVAVAAAASVPHLAAMGEIARAEVYIAAAFGGSDSESVQHPEKFDDAQAAYDAAVGKAKGTPVEDLLVGRIEEGYAALADYRKKKAEICPHAIASLTAFRKAGATAMLEGPLEIGRSAKCAIPPELAGGGEKEDA